MHPSKFLSICAASIFLFSLQTNATVINGVNYKKYTGGGSTCPDGSKVYVYKTVKYCKSYIANISWSIPTTRTNGSALPIGELKGYEVYWTRSLDKASGTIKVSSSTQAKTAFEVYTPSTYYFAMSAIDTKGLKSPLSTMVEAKLGK